MESSYIALIVTLVIWLGLFLYLLRLDGRIKKLEQRSR
ncbi:MAG: CcmD family protein [Candidatus Zixiibacteriota bacterium]|nr:MAG: CcmD family protein [candidate division Zixibacteria bacterium]